jgi:heavy metal translocating P-type ATPase
VAKYCCFGCLSLGEQRQQEATAPTPPRKLDWLGFRLGVSLIVVAQSMIFGLALNLHDDVPATVRWIAQNIILGATLLVVILLGGPLFRAACHELRKGRLTIEALFLLTMSGALAASLQAHITGRGKIYFEVVSILLVVYTLGKTIGAHSRTAALSGSRVWAGQFEMCRLVDSQGRTRMIPVREVQIGDRVEVNPGETFAVDGVIREGVGFVSEAAVSGEPFAIVRRPGDRVLAGAASHDATFRIEATARGTERQLDGLLAAVEQARDKPVSLQAQADRLGRWFFPLVVFTALGTFGYWTFLTTEGWERGLFNAMSVLLVACPCVIGLATPIVIWSALGRLAERGVIVRAGEAVERLAEIDCVMLDKTGTLTDDSFTILDIATLASGEERVKLLGWLSLVQECSGHPIARAFAKLPRQFAPGEEPRIDSLRAIPGCGVEADLQEATGARHIIQIGTPEWISSLSEESHRLTLTSHLRATGHRIEVAVDGEVVAIAVLAERLRDSATQALRGFGRLGLPVEVLTGDTAERSAALNLTKTRAVLLPSDKLAVIEAAKTAGGKPLFVGDGINDAAALASAHVGIALASGTDIAVTAAPVTLYHNDLRVLPWAIELSREAVRAVRRNMYRACAYNLIGMSLAACGLLHPVAAAVLMVVSSLSLVFSSTKVGAITEHCCEERVPAPASKPEPTRRLAHRSVLHALGFALQGIVFLLLLEPARTLPAAAIILGCFALAGCSIAYLWHRWAAIPHRVDMCVGMLTLGNLGMLLGWWIDNGCTALHDHGCCGCVEAMREGAMRPWMWLGMLVFANVAMLWLSRRPVQRGTHCAAMFSGGNLGMVVGMLVGGWCASQFETASMSLAVAASFAGMTVGMLVGMLLGTWVTERVFTALQPTRLLRRWLKPRENERYPGVETPGYYR